MQYLIWFEFVARLATAIATAQGADPRALAYLSLLTAGARARTLTDADLTALKTKYEADVAAGTPVTAAQLAELDQRIAGVSAAIQAS